MCTVVLSGLCSLKVRVAGFDLLYSSFEGEQGEEVGMRENRCPAGEASQHSYITSSSNIWQWSGQAEKKRMHLTGWLGAHFQAETVRHRIAGPPTQPHSPKQNEARWCFLIQCLSTGVYTLSVTLLSSFNASYVFSYISAFSIMLQRNRWCMFACLCGFKLK